MAMQALSNTHPIVIHSDAGKPVTTSLAIAEGVGRPHASVIRLVRDNLPDLQEFGPLGFEIHVVNRPQGGGAKTEYAILNEQQATLLLTYFRNNKVVRRFKKTLVKSFYEMRDQLMERNLKPESPEDIMARALRVANQVLEERERLLDEAKPKIAFHDQVTAAPDAISVGEAAKILGTGRRRLFAFLRHQGWVTRKNEPYQRRIEEGLLDVKLGSWEHPDHGLQQSVTTLVTGKGLARLRQLWEQPGLEVSNERHH